MSDAAAKRKSVLANRNFALLFWGDFVSNVGNTFFSFAVSFYILQISGDNALLQGIFLAVGGVARLLLSPLGGVLADRWNKVKIIWGTDIIRGVTIFLTGGAVLLFAEDYGAQIIVLFISTVILNVCGAFFSPASASIIKFIVPDSGLQQATSAFSTSQSIVGIIGVLLAGVFYSAFGFFWVVILDGASFLLSALSELFIHYDFRRSEDSLTLPKALTEMKQGFVYIRSMKPIFAMTVIALGLNFFISPLSSNGIVYFCNTFIKGDFLLSGVLTKETWLSVIETLMSLGMLASSLLIGSQKQPERCGRKVKRGIALIGFCVLAMCLSFFCIFKALDSLNGFLIALSVCALAMGLSLPTVNIRINVALIRAVSPDMLGKTESILSALAGALVPIGSFLAGILIQGLGLGSLFIFSTVGFLLMTVYATFNKDLEKL